MDDVREMAAKNGYNLHKPGQPELALRDAIATEVLAEEAKKQGLFNDPEIQRLVKNLAVQKLLKDKVDGAGTAPTVTDEEAKAYYQQNPAEFSNPTLAKGRVLQLIRKTGEEDKLAAKVAEVKASAIASADFAEVVKKFADLPSDQATGGATNWIQKDQPSARFPKEVTDALFAGDPKAVPTGPIETPQGVWFVKTEDRRDGGLVPFDSARRTISQRMTRSKRLGSYEGYVSTLKKEISIEEYPDRLKAVVEREAKQSGPPMGPVRLAK